LNLIQGYLRNWHTLNDQLDPVARIQSIMVMFRNAASPEYLLTTETSPDDPPELRRLRFSFFKPHFQRAEATTNQLALRLGVLSENEASSETSLLLHFRSGV
jgi:hypothetical protein